MEIKLEDIYDKDLNFLIGSGASYGLFPTLEVKIKDNEGKDQTIETLATHFDQTNNVNARTLLLMHYFKTCVAPILKFNFELLGMLGGSPEEEKVIENYDRFLQTILSVLNKRKINDNRTCNLFTTNYDNCIAYASDELLRKGKEDFVLNDGSRGFLNRLLSARNYNTHTKYSGAFDRYATRVRQINLIPLHGSIAWQKSGDNIIVEYAEKSKLADEISKLIPNISPFSECLQDPLKNISDLEAIKIDVSKSHFLNSYTKLPIVNPTKWKFHETVFEEHYYQMLRFLSYELEKPNAILVTFGFSFKDEHILNLIKRSLSNPNLQIYIACYDAKEHAVLAKKFEQFNNVSLITEPSGLDFTSFNSRHFTITPASHELYGGEK